MQNDVLAFVARQRIVEAAHVAERFRLPARVAAAHLGRFEGAGIITRSLVFAGEPALYRATAAGLRASGLRGRQWPLSIASVRHDTELTAIAIALEREFGTAAVLTRRDMRAAGQSARFALLPGRGGRRGYPDLAIETPAGLLSVEYERVQKPRRYLVALLRAYVLARGVDQVRLYAASPKVERDLHAALRAIAAPPQLFTVMRWATGDSAAPPPRPRPAAGRLSEPQREALRWLARQRVATAAHLEARFGIAPSTAKRRLDALETLGLAAGARVIHGDPRVWWATPAGLRRAGLPSAGHRVKLTTYRHDLGLTTLCIELEDEFPHARVLTERQLRHVEALEGPTPLVTRPRTFPGGGSRHFPDLAVDLGGPGIAIELERTSKTRAHIDRIVGAYLASQIGAVRYYVTSAAVERSVLAALARAAAPAGLFEVRRR